MGSKILIALGCDCDPDRLAFGGPRLDRRHEPLTWRGVTEGVEMLMARLDALPFFVPVTWNVRCDEQIAAAHGRPEWLFEEHARLWDAARRRGDEIAWHNHSWRWSDAHGCWRQEVDDAVWIAENYAAWGEAFRRGAGETAYTSHGGWFFQNGATLTALARAGVRLDYSALPGRAQAGFAAADGSVFANDYDWSITPRSPYFPSAADYRRAAADGEASLPILVASTYTFWGALASAFQFASHLVRRRAGGQETTRAQQTMSVVTATNHPAIYSGLIDYAIRERPASMFLYFHADELLTPKPGWQARIFSAEHCVQNLRRLAARLARAGIEPVFCTGRQIGESFWRTASA